MSLDLAGELVAALKSQAGREALRAALAPVIEEVGSRMVRAELDRREERLEPLSEILNLSADTARKRISADATLRALGHRGARRQLLFRRSAVLAYYRERGR